MLYYAINSFFIENSSVGKISLAPEFRQDIRVGIVEFTWIHLYGKKCPAIAQSLACILVRDECTVYRVCAVCYIYVYAMHATCAYACLLAQ